MSLIQTKNLVKDYLSSDIVVKAVRGVSLEINKGEFAALWGPSGSGKTTLLNIIGGLDNATSGKVSVDGQELTNMSAGQLSDLRLNKIGFIFQAYNLIPVLTALENVEYILFLQGVKKSVRRQRSVQMMRSVGLGDKLNSLPAKLSGGQQQRVAVARAMVSQPGIILADEPTANLDQKTGAELLDVMHTLCRNSQTTFLFSTHDPMVMDRSERLIHLVDGKIAGDEVRCQD